TPAEALRSARRGADPHVQRRACAEVAREPPEAVVQQRYAARPLALEARPWAPRRELELERDARGVGGHQDRLLVDCDDALPATHLLGDEVLEQVLAHHPIGVCRRAL